MVLVLRCQLVFCELWKAFFRYKAHTTGYHKWPVLVNAQEHGVYVAWRCLDTHLLEVRMCYRFEQPGFLRVIVSFILLNYLVGDTNLRVFIIAPNVHLTKLSELRSLEQRRQLWLIALALIWLSDYSHTVAGIRFQLTKLVVAFGNSGSNLFIVQENRVATYLRIIWVGLGPFDHECTGRCIDYLQRAYWFRSIRKSL